jgi:hypothetical protein
VEEWREVGERRKRMGKMRETGDKGKKGEKGERRGMGEDKQNNHPTYLARVQHFVCFGIYPQKIM